MEAKGEGVPEGEREAGRKGGKWVVRMGWSVEKGLKEITVAC